MTKQRCSGCRDVISESDLVMRTSFDDVYHVSCFSCVTCRLVIASGKQYGVARGHIYCSDHFPIFESPYLTTPSANSHIDPRKPYTSSFDVSNQKNPPTSEYFKRHDTLKSFDYLTNQEKEGLMRSSDAASYDRDTNSVISRMTYAKTGDDDDRMDGHGNDFERKRHYVESLNNPQDVFYPYLKGQASMPSKGIDMYPQAYMHNNNQPLINDNDIEEILENEDNDNFTSLHCSYLIDSPTNYNYNNSSNNSNSNSNRQKRLRTSFKHYQLRSMKSFFAINHNPDAKDLKELAHKTNLSKRVLQVWFQNARAKYRRNVLKGEMGKSDGEGKKQGYIDGVESNIPQSSNNEETTSETAINPNGDNMEENNSEHNSESNSKSFFNSPSDQSIQSPPSYHLASLSCPSKTAQPTFYDS